MTDIKTRLRHRLVEAAGPIAAFICDRADAQALPLMEWIDYVTTQLDLDMLRSELLDIARPSLPTEHRSHKPERDEDFEHLLALARARLERYLDAQTARMACDQARSSQLTDRRSLYRHLSKYLPRDEDRSLFVKLYGS